MALLYHTMLIACAAPRVTVPTGPPATTAPLRDSWTARTWEDKYDLMTGFVLPEMSVLFMRHYGQRDPVMRCGDCHGANAEAVAYRMPNELPALDPRHLPAGNEREVAFMTDEVTPKMRTLLDKQSFDCFGCHPKRSRPGETAP